MNDVAPTNGQLNYIRAEDVATQIHRSRRWVLDWTRAGVIPSIKIGREHFYEPGAVDQAIREAKVTGGPRRRR